ncbi:MAG: nuclear transport factor 2 family protein [Mucilaginibacter sp.]|nr:nuclear transport factor 2 family protein [Mucilaginibacter sp.]
MKPFRDPEGLLFLTYLNYFSFMTNTLRTIFATVTIALFAACNQEPEKPAVVPGGQSRKLIDLHFQYLNDHNLTDLINQYADKAKITTNDWDGESYGRQGADQMFHQIFYVSPDAKYLVDNVINNDSTMIVEYDVIGLHDKLNSPIRYDLRNCSIFKIKNDQIVSEATYSNSRLYHAAK